MRRCTSAQRCKRTPCGCHHSILTRHGPPFTQNGRMRIISALPFGTTGRVHSGCGDLAAHGSDRRRGPRPIKARAVVICMREIPGLAQPSPCGLFRHARSQAHAHVHSACAASARDATAHVHVASELALPFVASRPGSSPRLHRGMRDQARAVRRVLLLMRACIRHNG